MSDEKNKLKEQQAQTPVQRVRNDWKTLVERLSYRGIVNNIPYLAFVALLCVLYINNNQRAVETQRELNKQTRILKELHWEYMDVKSQMMYAQMETEVMKNASKIGLKPMVLPAFTIKTDSATTKL